MEVAVFVLFAALALSSALVVVLHRNPIYAVMSLVVTFISIAVLFVLLGAPFLAAVQVLVYTGAILVLFLFVIMLLNVSRDAGESGLSLQQALAAIVGVGFALLLGTLFWSRYQGIELSPLQEADVALQPLARSLLGAYLLPFEIVGLLLLAAVTAATVLARRSKGEQT
ncbi:MAG: NADH-quinone oxidoreductase subunit J [Thermoanaerobaculia bacterium]